MQRVVGSMPEVVNHSDDILVWSHNGGARPAAGNKCCGARSGKARAVKDMPDSTNVSELQRLLVVNYLMKFIPHLAEKTHPLRMLLRQDTEWVWGQL
ncbi:hypothetical protein PR048_018815 [Dryococelus australis]|uniref:Uncharacterized protein n=1 Tax=Dryococelus australis TaxID=614101 RepID=A0ABQ9H1T1_9NEOP|nr:hypothetical protein PR048_018815 [Dryococelus australis]